MISAVGVRNVVEAKVDFSKSRNTIIAAIILVLALGSNGVSFSIGEASISISALATASVVGIILNVIFREMIMFLKWKTKRKMLLRKKPRRKPNKSK